MNSVFKKKNTIKTNGFTLVEFIVIMGIFSIMVGVVMFNFTSFRSTITLDNLAQDIALSIRQVQTSAGAGQTLPDRNPTNEEFRGIAFIPDTTEFKSSFLIYKTSNSNSSAYIENDSIILDQIDIKTPDKITAIYPTNDPTNNDPESPLTDIVSIAFQRFKTDANFSVNGEIIQNSHLCIVVESPDNTLKKRVCVSKIGQISVY
jgi:type II secretory pathway pseudopilin PulG